MPLEHALPRCSHGKIFQSLVHFSELLGATRLLAEKITDDFGQIRMADLFQVVTDSAVRFVEWNETGKINRSRHDDTIARRGINGRLQVLELGGGNSPSPAALCRPKGSA